MERASIPTTLKFMVTLSRIRKRQIVGHSDECIDLRLKLLDTGKIMLYQSLDRYGSITKTLRRVPDTFRKL
jgi:hypothetical protein